MIVDLNLNGQTVIVVGGGAEGLKKINSLMTQNCKIYLFSDATNAQINKYIKAKKIIFRRIVLKNADFLSGYTPYMVMASTDNKKLNRQIVTRAKNMGCLAYASDDPDVSDFAHPSVINIQDTVQIAISTGGRSPAMAKKIRIKAEKIFKEGKVITSQDIAQIKLQHIARNHIKKISNKDGEDSNNDRNSTQLQRKAFLYSIIKDPIIKESLKRNDFKKATRRINVMVKEWKISNEKK